MGAFIDMLTAPPKGLRRLPPYRPVPGTRCEESGPHCDDDNGYTWKPTTILWSNDIFVLYGNEGYWPVLHKWEHCLFRPLSDDAARAEGGAE